MESIKTGTCTTINRRHDNRTNRTKTTDLVRTCHADGHEGLPRLAEECYPPNRRKGGRPAHTWRKGVEETTARRDLRENAWHARKLWRIKLGTRRHRQL